MIPDWLSNCYRLRVAWRDPAKEAKMLEFDQVPFEPAVPMQEFSSHIQLWGWFGGKLKLDQEALLMGDCDLRRRDGGHLVGCSWIRCPLFGEDLAVHIFQPIMLCSVCRKVRISFLVGVFLVDRLSISQAQYCSLECQKGYEAIGALHCLTLR